MSLRGVTIKEGTIGGNVAGDGREFGLICNGVAVTGKAQLETLIKLRRPSDAEAVGINAAWGSTRSQVWLVILTRVPSISQQSPA
jgi:hypothetical protein